MAVLALDIGGTKIAAALVSPEGEVLREQRLPTGADPWATCLTLLEQVAGDDRVDGVGAGCSGPMLWPSGVISPLNIPHWQDFPLRDRLAQRWPEAPVRVHNDAVCFAMGEHWRGAGRGVDDQLGMVVSTGVGGGLILGGRVLDGPSGNAGHVGHLVAEHDGPPCQCGGRGCLEAIARGPAVVARARARGCSAEDGVALARLAAEGDPVAREELARAGRAVGRTVASAAALLDLRRVVIGGGLASSGPALWEPLQEAFASQARLSYLSGADVVPAQLGGHAGLVGAARLVLDA